MNRICRVRRTSTRGASSPGTSQSHASQPSGREPQLARQPGRDGLPAQIIQDMAAGAGVAVGQARPAPATASSRWRGIPVPRLLPHTIQLCIHCRYNPAGFWVSRTSDQTVRRPWCLSCCEDLDPASHHIRPFDLQYLR
jgi:hypothetical protein